MSGAVKATGSVGSAMSESNVTVDEVDANATGTTHGMRTEGAALGIGTTKSGEDNMEIRAVTMWVAL